MVATGALVLFDLRFAMDERVKMDFGPELSLDNSLS